MSLSKRIPIQKLMMLQFENDFALLSTYEGCSALERKYGTVNNTDEIEPLIVSDEINKIDFKKNPPINAITLKLLIM